MSRIARILRLGLLFITFALPLATQPVSADLDLDTSAAYFGQLPDAWGMRLSPDG